ncbi:hypothetical protein RSOLAG1IB_11305 [Rhizoctonia solani AG-1 IB]|nr:hypothetical protein RSOLAG1IB_11305 [Rhizoctonia solani AG-1 IB]
MRGNTFVYPSYETSTPDWWQGVVGYGYIAALTGDFKFFVWGGVWNEDWDGKHVEAVVLHNIMGIQKESDKHWRDGTEETLWLETKAGYSYALLEPQEDYDRGFWAEVIESWHHLPGGLSQEDPSFVLLSKNDARPSWFKGKTGDRAWSFFTRPDEKPSPSKKAKKPKTEKAKVPKKPAKAGEKATKGQVSKGKQAAKARPAQRIPPSSTDDEGESTAATSQGKRKRDSDADTREKLRPRKVRPAYVEIESDPAEKQSASGDDDGGSKDGDGSEMEVSSAEQEESDKKPAPKLMPNTTPGPEGEGSGSGQPVLTAASCEPREAAGLPEADSSQPGTTTSTQIRQESQEVPSSHDSAQPGASQSTGGIENLAIGDNAGSSTADEQMTLQHTGRKSPDSPPRPQYIVGPAPVVVPLVRYSTPLPSDLDDQTPGSGPVSMFDAPTPEPEPVPSSVMSPLPEPCPEAPQLAAAPAESLPPAPTLPVLSAASASPPPPTPGSIPAEVVGSPAHPGCTVFASLLTPVTHVSGGESGAVTSEIGSESRSTETAPAGPVDSPAASPVVPPVSVHDAGPAIAPRPTSVRNVDEFDLDGVCSSRFMPGS